MKWTNYHSHSSYSDGKGEPELYALSAIKHQMYSYGFSCHSPVPFSSGWNMKFENLVAYINEINRLKEKYSKELKIYLGLEIDYVEGIIGISHYKNFGLDYSIGGVHFLGFMDDGSPWDFDRGKSWFEKGLNELFGGDIKKLVSHYYQQVINMLLTQKTDVLAHIDLIKKYNEGNIFFDEDEIWYKKLLTETLEIVKKTDTIIEVNTRGVLKKLNSEFYPSNAIIKQCQELKIPVCLSSDAHNSDDVMAFLPEARELLQSTGYQDLFIFDEQGWHPVSIE
jgi:histidinol-phosphatase (PHP family)